MSSLVRTFPGQSVVDWFRQRRQRRAENLRRTATQAQKQSQQALRELEDARAEIQQVRQGTQRALELAAKQEAAQRRLEAAQSRLSQEVERHERESQQDRTLIRQEMACANAQLRQSLSEVEAEQARRDAAIRQEMKTRHEALGEDIQRLERQTRAGLEEVKRQQEEERRARLSREQEHQAETHTLVAEVRQRIPAAADQERFGLRARWTDAERHAQRAEVQHNQAPQAALAAAGSALVAVETAEEERQKREIQANGAADEAAHAVGEIREIIADEAFSAVFPEEVAPLRQVADEVEARSQEWRSGRAFTAFEAEHREILKGVHEEAVRASELQDAITGVERQLGAREDDVRRVAEDIAAKLGMPDRLERSYLADDPKKPRRLRLQYGPATLDVYFELDGQRRGDVSGCRAETECARYQALLLEVLEQDSHAVEVDFDPGNRQDPIIDEATGDVRSPGAPSEHRAGRMVEPARNLHGQTTEVR